MFKWCVVYRLNYVDMWLVEFVWQVCSWLLTASVLGQCVITGITTYRKLNDVSEDEADLSDAVSVDYSDLSLEDLDDLSGSVRFASSVRSRHRDLQTTVSGESVPRGSVPRESVPRGSQSDSGHHTTVTHKVDTGKGRVNHAMTSSTWALGGGVV
jgi:hypothetical protein